MNDQPSTNPTDPVEPSGSGTPAVRDGRARLVAALRQAPSRGQVVAGVLLAVLGFGAVVQVQATDRDDRYVGARQSELVQLINNLSLATRRAETQVQDLERTRDSLLDDTQARRTALERARQQADTLGILAGTLPAVGPGVMVTVDDPNRSVGTDQLLNGLQELRDAGAEAIAINDAVRVVAQTSLRNGDAGVVVDGRLLRPPYVVSAIGSPGTLAAALDFQDGFIDQVEKAGGSVRVQEADAVRITSVRQPAAQQYAEPVPTG